MDNTNEEHVVLIQLLDLIFEPSDDESDMLEFFVESSSSSEDEIQVVTAARKRRKINKRPRLQNYVERVVPNYTAQEFKMHFRYIFNYKYIYIL